MVVEHGSLFNTRKRRESFSWGTAHKYLGEPLGMWWPERMQQSSKFGPQQRVRMWEQILGRTAGQAITGETCHLLRKRCSYTNIFNFCQEQYYWSSLQQIGPFAVLAEALDGILGLVDESLYRSPTGFGMLGDFGDFTPQSRNRTIHMPRLYRYFERIQFTSGWSHAMHFGEP